MNTMDRPDAKDLTHILALLDDESPVVREAISERLAGFGDELPLALRSLETPPSDTQLRQIIQILGDRNREWLREAWPRWQAGESDLDKLETANVMLAEFLGGRVHPVGLGELLDRLADEYRRVESEPDPVTLSRFLFQDLKLGGDEWNYNHPDNSNLVHVIEKKLGIPLSLATIYMLVGKRVGVPVQGCNLPGHFLARVVVDEKTMFVDCFNGGKFLEMNAILAANPKATRTIQTILDNDVTAETMVIRVLNNLSRAFEKQGDTENQILMAELIRRTEVEEGDPEPGSASGPARYIPGQLVRHRRYGYRGVVVSVDPECRADERWYKSNRTQPPREQPWYSVLVDGTEQVTYAAESNLTGDDSDLPVEHPLLQEFFNGFQEGAYLRNAKPWPGW